MQKFTLIFALMIVAVLLPVHSSASLETAPLQIGEDLPSLGFGSVVQGKRPSAGAQALVIEFWATWCAPCRKTIPYLNELASEFKDRPLEFVHITDENVATVSEFLRKNQIEGTVTTDPRRGLAAAFGLAALPTTVLVDAKGRIVAVTEATKITAGHLESLVKGLDVGLTDSRLVVPQIVSPIFGPPEQALTRVYIRSSIQPDSSSLQLPNGYQGKGVRLIDLISQAYDVQASRISMAKELEGLRYDVDISVQTRRSEKLQVLLRSALEAATPVLVIPDERVMKVLVLRDLPGHLKPATQQQLESSRCEAGGLTADAISLPNFASCIENALGVPTIVESPQKGLFTIHAEWPRGDSQQLRTALERDLGIKTVLEKRSIRRLIVSRMPLPHP